MVKVGGKREKLFERFSHERWMLLFLSPPTFFREGVCFCSYFQRIVVFLPRKEEERSRGRAVEKGGGRVRMVFGSLFSASYPVHI